MTASPLEYIDVSISREIPVVTRVGFGTLLFVYEGESGDRVKEYADLDSLSGDFTSTDEAYKATEVYFSQAEPRPSRILLGRKGGAETYVEAIQAIRAVNDDWYGVAIESRDAANILPTAAYINAVNKVFLAATADADVPDAGETGDVASTLLDLNRDRTLLFYHSQAATLYPEVALAGRMLPLDPGSATWAWKTLSGIPSDNLSAPQRSALEAKRATYYTNVAGNNVTFEGATSQLGVFLDIIRGSDWLKVRMAEDIVAKLASTNKIPYIGGEEIFEQLIRSRLDIAVDRGLIAEGYSVIVPVASEQEASDRAARIYRNITFRAVLTGAVHKAEIRGTVTV